ncbi:MAG: 50S ribosomal protein L10 [Chloroflexota bacterium]|nr:50S ribosomal protein L10 [Chloroflexota bacterium]
MAISREKKEQLVEQYVELLNNSQAIVLTDYRGMSVQEIQDLRKEMRERDAQVQVVKNTLIKMALERTGMPVPEEHLTTPTAIAYMPDDIATAAKVLFAAAKASNVLEIKAAILEGQVLDAEGAMSLRDLPTRIEVRAQLLGSIQSPASELARTIEAPANELYRTLEAALRELALTIQAYSEKGASA